MSSHARGLVFAYLLLFSFWALSYFIVIPVPLNLIVTSTAIVYIGSYRSLNLLVSEANGGPRKEEKETLSASDAYKFPFVGSAALFGLYVAFKYFDKDTVNLLLSFYFSLVGVLTLTGSLSKFVSQFLTAPAKYGFKKTFPLVGELDLLFTVAELVSLVISIVFSVFYFRTKHYMMNNIFGISFCIQSLERISLGSYSIGAILLVGLFFYDIFWVFGTDVMVTVAKSFDGPIKLLFPRVLAAAGEKSEFSLLGLGDIVIPGLFVALLLRFDAHRAGVVIHSESNADGTNTTASSNTNFPQPYFISNVIAYALGLLTTVAVMFFFQAAQPALLYLVPACLGASLCTAMVRGELSHLLAYSEEEKEKEKEKKEQ
jgi:minor histocompatibility antigen H13